MGERPHSALGNLSPREFVALAYNGGLTRKTRTMVGTENGATSITWRTLFAADTVSGGKVTRAISGRVHCGVNWLKD